MTGEPSERRSLIVRMADVASRAGVSRATVSRVLSNTTPVSAETRDAVMAAVEQLGYVTNTVAQQLARRNSTTIGLLVRDPSNPIFGSLTLELQRAAEDAGLHIVSFSPGTVSRHNDEAVGLTRLMGTRPAGLLVASGSLPLDDLRPFAAQVPTVILPRPMPDPGFSAVSFDEEDNAKVIATAVAGHGHRVVCVVLTPSRFSAVESLRSNGIAAQLVAHGVDVVAVTRSKDSDSTANHARLDLAVADGATAIMFPNDRQAASYIAYLRKSGRQPGRDVSVTGIDGVPLWAPALGLATVEVPVARVARKAIELMVDGLSGNTQISQHAFKGRLRLGSSLARLDPR